MRIRKKKWAAPELDACSFFIKNPAEHRGHWQSVFKSEQPIDLEVGCGKGTFAAEKALRNPSTNYIAVDIKSDMLGVARRNIVSLFDSACREVDNLVLVAYNVDRIDTLLSSDDRINNIYINFCNPWPRLKHNKRRLTHPTKLELYKTFLRPGGTVYFKTDNDELFDDSIEYFRQCGYEITFITRDLHNSSVLGNIVTEHERMFSEQGIMIKYLTAVLPG